MSKKLLIFINIVRTLSVILGVYIVLTVGHNFNEFLVLQGSTWNDNYNNIFLFILKGIAVGLLDLLMIYAPTYITNLLIKTIFKQHLRDSF